MAVRSSDLSRGRPAARDAAASGAPHPIVQPDRVHDIPLASHSSGHVTTLPQAVAGQKTQTFEALLAPVVSPAYRFAIQLTGNLSDAEDLVQEASLHAFRGFDSFQPDTNFRAWFFRILANCCYAKHRERKRRPQTVDFDDVPDLYMYARTAEAGLHGHTRDPAALVLGEMSIEQIRAAIDALPAEYRAVCSLYFLDDMAYDEIAVVLGCPVGTVRSRLHRGRKMLQKSLWTIAVDAGIVDRLVKDHV